MTEREYRDSIPHTCTVDFDFHVNSLGLCWSITHGRHKRVIDDEGPRLCHDCPLGVHAKRKKCL